MVAAPESDWDAFDLALEVCRHHESSRALDVCRSCIADLAERAAERASAADDDVYSLIGSINSVLFEEEGFAGNREDFYSPSNSYLTQVLETRQGIPITLSLIFRRLAEAVGLHLEYVGMPGHFLLKCRLPARELFIDAFNNGQIMLAEECRQRLEATYEDLEFRPEFLRSVTAREVVLRLLLNLKQIYRKRGENEPLVAILGRRILLVDDPLPERLERGLARAALHDFRGALDDLTFFVESTTDQELKTLIQQRLEEVRLLAAG